MKDSSEEQLVSDFISTVSHELRTPLTAIKGSLDGLGRGYGRSPEAAARLLEIARVNADRLGRLIDDLLDMSRFERKGVLARSEPVAPGPLIRELVAAKLPAAEQRQIDLSYELGEAGEKILGDPDRLYQALANLVDNAIKFCRAGDAVRLSVRARADRVIVRVADTGPGMDPAHHEAIFEKFRQLDSSEHRRAGGLGLGLYITREIVTAMGGEIAVLSERGQGATFELSLPLFAGSRPEPPASRDILVVDDDPSYAHFLEVVLTKAGFTVHLAQRAAQGEEDARRIRPGLVLLDLMMPEMDGWTLLERLEADPATRDIPKIILSALRPDPGAHRFRSYRYIEKTGHPGQIVEAVEAAMGGTGMPVAEGA